MSIRGVCDLSYLPSGTLRPRDSYDKSHTPLIDMIHIVRVYQYVHLCTVYISMYTVYGCMYAVYVCMYVYMYDVFVHNTVYVYMYIHMCTVYV